MRPIKAIVAILGTAFMLIGLFSSMNVMAAPLEAARLTPQLDPEPAFTRLVTITVEAGVSFQQNLNSVWQQTIIGFPVGPEGYTVTKSLPDDATNITATVNNGDFSINGTSIEFRLLPGLTDLGWSYRTGQEVARTGNQYQIDQAVASNNFYRLISTILFPSSYEYVGSDMFTPQTVTTGTVQWDLIVPKNPENGQHEFKVSSWLVDPRLAQPDLIFVAAALTIESGLNPPIAHLTATVRNSNTQDITSTVAYLEFYDRAAPSVPPSGPLDHAGGWCGADTAPACPDLATFMNPLASLGPGESITVTMDYSLTQPGLRDFYFQIDTFGGPKGLNVELYETNNVLTLTRGATIDYLASVVISGPITGTAHTPIVFHAQVAPTLAVNRPLTYTWSPAPFSGQGTADAIYTWVTGTPHAITVTARNARQTTVTDTHAISIEVPLSGAFITGPLTVTQNTPHVYRVTAQPVTATLPVSYLWDPEPDQGQATTVATYTLSTLGEYLFRVYVSNPVGQLVVATQTVKCVPPLATVAIDGPTTGRPNTIYAFTATVEPVEAAPPLIYQWVPAPASGQGTPHASYSWTTSGPRFITVTVKNDGSPVSVSHTITIDSVVYLPLLIKN